MAQTIVYMLYTHLKCSLYKSRIKYRSWLFHDHLKTGEGALFKRDHSKKILKTLTESMKCVSLWKAQMINPKPKGISRCTNVFLIN